MRKKCNLSRINNFDSSALIISNGITLVPGEDFKKCHLHNFLQITYTLFFIDLDYFNL